MKESFRKNYFLLLKIIMFLVLNAYLLFTNQETTGVSIPILLFWASMIALFTISDFVSDRNRYLLVLMEFVLVLIINLVTLNKFSLLYTMVILEFLCIRQKGILIYALSYIGCIGENNQLVLSHILICSLFSIIYYQHSVIISSYIKQINENEEQEHKLKKDIYHNEIYYQKELSKSLLATENNVLEEKARLSQALHDKLGHSINGSIYQLEACKVLLEKNPEKSESMIQAVIDHLRNSMDEIRAILRKESPDKHKLAVIQLHSLCDDLNNKGIETDLKIEGDIKLIPNKYLEIILDNIVEGMSNSLKYSRCTKIKIDLAVLNKLVRCKISDNGIGCSHLVDGMGVSGMRKRMRSINGILDIDGSVGFSINMIFQLDELERI